MTRTTLSLFATVILAGCLLATIALAASGGDFDLTWHTIDGGGGTSASASYELSGTIGQPDAGVMSGGEPGNEFVLVGAFWAASADTPDPTTPCYGDLTGSGAVGVPDLLALLGCWGPVGPGSGCESADLTGSGTVGVPDLLALLGQWGPCPE